MSHKFSKTKMLESYDENTDDNFDFRPRTQSTSHLLSPDSVTSRTISSRQDRSLTPSPTPSSSSSLILGASPKTTSISFHKNASSNHKTNVAPPPEDGFIMTIIRSPSTSSQRTPSNEPVTPPVANEELSNNGSFLRNKVTAALNHMKYRKLFLLLLSTDLIYFRLGCSNATNISYK